MMHRILRRLRYLRRRAKANALQQQRRMDAGKEIRISPGFWLQEEQQYIKQIKKLEGAEDV